MSMKISFDTFCFIFCQFYFSVLCMDKPQEITKLVSNTLNNHDTTTKYKNLNKTFNILGVHTVIEIKQTLMYWFIIQKERTVKKNGLLMDMLHIDSRWIAYIWKHIYERIMKEQIVIPEAKMYPNKILHSFPKIAVVWQNNPTTGCIFSLVLLEYFQVYCGFMHNNKEI